MQEDAANKETMRRCDFEDIRRGYGSDEGFRDLLILWIFVFIIKLMNI